MAKSKKLNTKQLTLQKRKRRQWITFMRMIRYGINNFSRNAWLTVAATAVMTITLLIVFMTLAARSTLVTTVDSIRDQVDMSIYLSNDTSEEDAATVVSDVKGLPGVKKVEYISPADARKDFAKQSKQNPDTLNALNQATNKFPGIVRVNLEDINDTSELTKFIETNQNYINNEDTDREPSFAGERKTAIQNIGQWVEVADRAGLGASIVFIVISSLIVFNTIRMAIFNRKEEIQMMKLIGADRSFIRGPFIVEAVVYGFIAAVLATVIGFLSLYAAKDSLTSFQIAIEPTLDYMMTYIGLIALGMVGLGGVIGVVSSLLATRKYLKI